MKILYNGAINAAEAKRRLENARPNADKTIWMEKRKGELFLELTGFRMSTTFQVKFTEEYLILKYSGFFSYMNIFVCSLWCGGYILAVLVWLVLSIMTQSPEGESVVGILAAGLPTFGFLWIFILKFRILARKYVYKILGLNAKK